MAFVNTLVGRPLRLKTASPVCSRALPTTTVPTCSASSNKNEKVTRRMLLGRTAAFALAAILGRSAREAVAVIDYPNVGFLGGGDKVDVNNANVRVYQKFPGLYPTIAGMIVVNGPFKNVDEVFQMKGLTSKQKEVLSKYRDNLVALEPTPEYEIDKINNGMY